jgi:8-oxo-dGTP diphosphatase
MQKGIDYIGNCVVFFCHGGKGNFLLGKRSSNCRDEQGCWDPGGGAIEFGDTVEKTIEEEILQEYCTTTIKSEFLGFRDVHRVNNDKPTHWIALDFLVQIDRSKVKVGEPHKCTQLEWFTLNQLPSPLHSQFQVCLDQYREKLFKI